VKDREAVDAQRQQQEQAQLQQWLAQAEWQAVLEGLRQRYNARILAG